MIMYNKIGLESSPLQVYASALFFCPSGSLIRDHFRHEGSNWIEVQPDLKNDWEPCLQTLEGHTENVVAVAFSHDSSLVASASDDSTVCIWDINSSACVKRLLGHINPLRSVSFSRYSTELASASYDGIIKIWHVSDGQCLQTFKAGREDIVSLAFLEQSFQLASVSKGLTVNIWDRRSGTCKQTLRQQENVPYTVSLAISHGSTQLASGSIDGSIRLWDVNNGACLKRWNGHSNRVTSISFAPDLSCLATGSSDNMVRIWDLTSLPEIQSSDDGSILNLVAFSPDTTKIASASGNGAIEIWDLSSGTITRMYPRLNGCIDNMTFSPDLAVLVSVSDVGTIKIWDMNSGACLQKSESISEAYDIVFASQAVLLALFDASNIWTIWNLVSGDFLRALDSDPDSDLVGTRKVGFSRDASRLGAGSSDRRIRIWDVLSGRLLDVLDTFNNVCTLAFSHDLKLVAVLGAYDGVFKIWDTNSKVCLQTNIPRGRSINIRSLAISSASERLASADTRGEINIWDTSLGERLHTFSARRYLKGMTFDATGWRLCTNIGVIHLKPERNSQLLPKGKDLGDPQYESASLSPCHTWLMYQGKRIFWIPPEYRPRCSAVSGNSVAIGSTTGGVWILRVIPQLLP